MADIAWQLGWLCDMGGDNSLPSRFNLILVWTSGCVTMVQSFTEISEFKKRNWNKIDVLSEPGYSILRSLASLAAY